MRLQGAPAPRQAKGLASPGQLSEDRDRQISDLPALAGMQPASVLAAGGLRYLRIATSRWRAHDYAQPKSSRKSHVAASAMSGRGRIHCCGCGTTVRARLTNGREIYPHRPDLADLPFWRCDGCGNHVGCHHKTNDPTRPLGNIPTPEIRDARKHIHAQLDPLWQNGTLKRGQVYARLSRALGRQYHTAEVRTIEEAREVYRAVAAIARVAVKTSASRGKVNNRDQSRT